MSPAAELPDDFAISGRRIWRLADRLALSPEPRCGCGRGQLAFERGQVRALGPRAVRSHCDAARGGVQAVPRQLAGGSGRFHLACWHEQWRRIRMTSDADRHLFLHLQAATLSFTSSQLPAARPRGVFMSVRIARVFHADWLPSATIALASLPRRPWFAERGRNRTSVAE